MPPRKKPHESDLGPGKGVENPSAVFTAFTNLINRDHYRAGRAEVERDRAYSGYLRTKRAFDETNEEVIESLDESPGFAKDMWSTYRLHAIPRAIAMQDKMRLLEQEFLRHEAEEERLRDSARVNSVMEVIARSARDMGLLDRTSQEAPVNKRRKTK